MNLKQKADRAKAEQLENMSNAKTKFDAYWAGSAVESLRLHYKHGAFHRIQTGSAAKAASRRRTNAALKAAIADGCNG